MNAKEKIESGNFVYTYDGQIAVRQKDGIAYYGGTIDHLVVNFVVKIDAPYNMYIGSMKAFDYACEAILHHEVLFNQKGSSYGSRNLYNLVYRRVLSIIFGGRVTIYRMFRSHMDSFKG